MGRCCQPYPRDRRRAMRLALARGQRDDRQPRGVASPAASVVHALRAPPPPNAAVDDSCDEFTAGVHEPRQRFEIRLTACIAADSLICAAIGAAVAVR